MKNFIKGGDLNPKDFNQKELSVGILVELEHTDDKEIAQDIALTHLSENPKYYSQGISCGIFDEDSALKLAKQYGWIPNRVKRFKEYTDINESLPRENSVKQLKRVMKLSKSTDIGNKMKTDGANLAFSRNPIDTGIESYEDFEKSNKKFKPNWNLGK
jgi:hypothetical protein